MTGTDVDGKPAAFDDFYEESYPRAVSLLCRQGAEYGDAEEAVQLAFVEVLRRWDKVSQMDRPQAYLLVIARNAWFGLMRGRRREVSLADEDIDETAGADTAEGGLVFAREAIEVMNVLKGLPPLYREVMALTFDGYTTREIAEFLDVPDATVRQRLVRGRRALSQAISQRSANSSGE